MPKSTARRLEDYPESLTVRQAAETLGIGLNEAYAACRAKRIPHLRIGARYIIPRRALQRILEDPSSFQ